MHPPTSSSCNFIMGFHLLMLFQQFVDVGDRGADPAAMRCLREAITSGTRRSFGVMD